MAILVDIINWIENKPLFWQEAVNRIIRNKDLSKEDIDDLAKICKHENGIFDLEYERINIDELKLLVSNSEAQESIILKKIKENENINALRDGSELSFSDTGLTVIYGDNGSGKSSYVSILKNTCNTRGIKPKINFNLFDSESHSKRQIAKVEYTQQDGTDGEVTWEDNELDSNLLNAIDVFDSLSANHYIDGEDEIAFIPSGLIVLEKLAQACNQVESVISSEIQISEIGSYDYSFLLDDIETEVSKFLRGLNYNSKKEELDKLTTHTEEDDSIIKQISENIAKLKATDPAKEIKENTLKIRRFNSLKTKYKLLEDNFSQKNLDDVKDKLNNFVLISEASKIASEKAFSNLPMNNIGNEQWKKLWESARKFYDNINGDGSFPSSSENDNCPLCLQELGEEAQNRFKNFEEFVKADLQEQLSQANKELDTIIEQYKNINFDFTEYEPTIDEISGILEDFKNIHEASLEALKNKREETLTILRSLKKVDSISSLKLDATLLGSIHGLISSYQTSNESLSKTSIKKELETLENKYANLVAIKKLTEHKEKTEEEIKRKKLIVALRKCSSQCNTRNVTLFSNSLSEKYVTDSLEANFKSELKKLGFKNIEIVMGTKGVRGRQYHYLQLDSSYGTGISLKDILSEGEHRCISLATFLSELSISEHKSTIIFDDPVSSLDHKWRRKIANRIVEEGNDRQVIVFTHDIAFLMMLQEESIKLTCAFEIKSLTRKKTETGIPASNPPWDALSVKGRLVELKNMHQVLIKTEEDETEELYNERVKPFYGKLRETWERLIEELILNKTVQRFGRAIQTNRLKKVIDLTLDDYQLVEDNMSKCSTMFNGHDSAGELIETMPDSEEVGSDLEILGKYIKELRARGRS